MIDTGFVGSPNADPIVVGDISGNGRTNAADASKVAQFAALIPVPEIPPIPAGIVIAGLAGANLGAGLPGVITGPPPLIDPSTNLATDDSSGGSSNSGESPTASTILPHPAVDRAMAELGNPGLKGDEEELRLALEDAVEELLSAGVLLD